MPRIVLACSLFFLFPVLTLAGKFKQGKEALDQKDFDMAIACFNAAIRKNPTNAAAYFYRSNAYAAKNDYDKAIMDMTEAIHLAPTARILTAVEVLSTSRRRSTITQSLT